MATKIILHIRQNKRVNKKNMSENGMDDVPK